MDKMQMQYKRRYSVFAINKTEYIYGDLAYWPVATGVTDARGQLVSGPVLYRDMCTSNVSPDLSSTAKGANMHRMVTWDQFDL